MDVNGSGLPCTGKSGIFRVYGDSKSPTSAVVSKGDSIRVRSGAYLKVGAACPGFTAAEE